MVGWSLRNTGHERAPSLASVSSSLVPRILKVDFVVSIGPYSGMAVLYLFFVGISVVTRSRSTVFLLNSTLDAVLSIFLRNIDAITEAEVW